MSIPKILWSPVNSNQFLTYYGTKVNLYNVIKYDKQPSTQETQGLYTCISEFLI